MDLNDFTFMSIHVAFLVDALHLRSICVPCAKPKSIAPKHHPYCRTPKHKDWYFMGVPPPRNTTNPHLDGVSGARPCCARGMAKAGVDRNKKTSQPSTGQSRRQEKSQEKAGCHRNTCFLWGYPHEKPRGYGHFTPLYGPEDGLKIHPRLFPARQMANNPDEIHSPVSPNPKPPNITLITAFQNTQSLVFQRGAPTKTTHQTHMSMLFRGRGRVVREGWQKPASTRTKTSTGQSRRQKQKASKKPSVIEIHFFDGSTPIKNHGGMAPIRRHMVPKMASRCTQGCFPPAKYQTTLIKSIVQLDQIQSPQTSPLLRLSKTHKAWYSGGVRPSKNTSNAHIDGVSGAQPCCAREVAKAGVDKKKQVDKKKPSTRKKTVDGRNTFIIQMHVFYEGDPIKNHGGVYYWCMLSMLLIYC
jgi:hypothetical protein